MYFLESEDVVYVDCDETLIFWKTDEDPNDRIIEVVDPYTGKYVKLVPHERHIELVQRKKGQGKAVVVWSAGGAKWAKTVVDGLGLEPFVDVVLCKPSIYIDDCPIENWGLQRVYLSKNFRGHPWAKDTGDDK